MDTERVHKRNAEILLLWGIQPNPAKETPTHTITRDGLIDLMHSIERKIEGSGCHVVPTSFEPLERTLSGFPRQLQWTWRSCERALRKMGSKSVMSMLPKFWQIEPALNTSCRNIGAMLFPNEPENLPIGAAAIQSIGIDTIVCGVGDSARFSLYLAERNILSPSWVLIHRIDSPTWEIPIAVGGTHVAQEVHLFPGVPVLTQCDTLIEEQKPRFHPSDSYIWEIGTETCITSIDNDPFPLTRLILPTAIQATGSCPCGRRVIEKKP